MSKLVLVRHGISEWNKLGLWTGWTDIELAPEGFEEAKNTAESIKDIHFDYAFVSDLIRAQQTLDTIKLSLKYDIPTTIAWQIKERDYGDLTKKNKWEIKQQYGDEQFNLWRRGWDIDIPGGENLKMVYERAVPYFKENIMPLIIADKNVLIVAHGNSLRALAKFIENISDEEIGNLEINTGEAFIYDFDKQGKLLNKEIRATNTNKV